MLRAAADNDFDWFEIALKGQQTGREDYFCWIRDGGGVRCRALMEPARAWGQTGQKHHMYSSYLLT